MSALVLALDRTGCLQTARWSDVNPSQWRQKLHRGAPDVPSDEIAQVENDEGLRETRVNGTTVVCGAKPPTSASFVRRTNGAEKNKK